MTLQNYQLSQDLSLLPPVSAPPHSEVVTITSRVPAPPPNGGGLLLALLFAFFYFQK